MENKIIFETNVLCNQCGHKVLVCLSLIKDNISDVQPFEYIHAECVCNNVKCHDGINGLGFDITSEIENAIRMKFINDTTWLFKPRTIKILDEYQDPEDNFFKRISVCEKCNQHIIEIETPNGLEAYNGCICIKNKKGDEKHGQ